MEDPDFFTCRVAIVGLGLMGGSLAQALRGKCRLLLGVDSHPQTLALARERSIVDRLSSYPGEILPDADLVVLATPVGAILKIIRELPNFHPGTPVVLDLGSTKVEVCQAFSDLPPRFDPIGGHPMCGKESLGLASADPAIFQGAPFALTPLERTSMRGRKLAEGLVQAIGALPVWLTADVHDRWVASTSHLPYILSVALALATPQEVALLVGPGFRSATRLAATPSSMMLDVVTTNKKNILKAARVFHDCWKRVEEALYGGDIETLSSLLDQAAENRRQITSDPQNGGRA